MGIIILTKIAVELPILQGQGHGPSKLGEKAVDPIYAPTTSRPN